MINPTYILGAAASALLVVATPTQAATTIDFETDGSGNATTAGSAIDSTYSALGLTFSNAVFHQCLGGCPAPNLGMFISSPNFLQSFTVAFGNGISNFTFSNVSNSGASAQAFDINGNLLTSVNFSGFPGTFTLNASGIRSVTFGVGTQFGVDDFSYEGSALAGAVPEPGVWAMMILGFGAIGAAMRRRKPLPQGDIAFA